MVKKASSQRDVLFLILSDRTKRFKVAEMIRKNGQTVEDVRIRTRTHGDVGGEQPQGFPLSRLCCLTLTQS